MDTKFFCIKTERGEACCGEQCQPCAKRRAHDHVEHVQPALKVVSQATEAPTNNATEEEQGPQIRGQIIITLWDNGDFKLDGPLHDRVMMRGLLSIALDQEGVLYRDVVRRAKIQMEARSKEPFWKRKVREGREALARRKAVAAAEEARRQQEELLKKQ